MKTLFFTAMLLSVLAFTAQADDSVKTFGTVDTIAVESNSFTLKGDDGRVYRFHINEGSEMEKKGGWFDSDIRITDLNAGDRAKVEYFGNNPNYLIVDELTVYSAKKK